jgi:hypothetical protein
MSAPDSLPPLPEPITVINTGMQALRGFSAEQMRAYALAAVLEEREACAKVCDDKERRKWEIFAHGGQVEGIGPLDCAAAIRSRTKEST